MVRSKPYSGYFSANSSAVISPKAAAEASAFNRPSSFLVISVFASASSGILASSQSGVCQVLLPQTRV